MRRPAPLRAAMAAGLAFVPTIALADGEDGIDTELTYTVDVIGNPVGGIQRGVSLLHNLNVIFTIDGDALGGAHGTSAKVFLHDNHFGTPNAKLVGSAQGVDNIEIGDEDHPLYEAWVQQRVAGETASLRVGLYDLSSEFYSTAASGLFLHPSYGIGADLAQTGPKGPSIFPLTALSARVKVAPHEAFYVQAAVLDAMPDDVRFDRGLLCVGEAGFTPSDTKVAAGGWYYTHEVADLMTAAARRDAGAYVVAERRVYAEPGSGAQGARVFARGGVAAPRVNQFDYAWSAGITYTGLVPSRDAGAVGVAIARVHNGDPFRRAAMTAGSPVTPSETQLELTYQDAITPWMTTQIDGQYVIHTGTDPSLADAVVIGSRVTATF